MAYYLRIFIRLLVATQVSSQGASVRLVDGSNNYSGRVEVFLNRQWGTVCDHDWGFKDGTVVCRQLGYSGVASIGRSAFSGQGVGAIKMDHVRCDGSESRLVDCPYYSPSRYCGHADDAGVVCNPSPTDCGFSYDESSGNITFEATIEGTCLLTTKSSADELIVVTIQSYSFYRKSAYGSSRCVNYLEDSETIDRFCGPGDLQKTYLVDAAIYELRVRTKDLEQDSRFNGHLQKFDSITSCTFDDSNQRCALHILGTSWSRGNTPTPCERWTSGRFISTDATTANFELSILPSREIVLFFHYAVTYCSWYNSGVLLKVDFCGDSQEITHGKRFLKSLACDHPSDTITFTAKTANGFSVYVDDILVWDLGNTGSTAATPSNGDVSPSPSLNGGSTTTYPDSMNEQAASPSNGDVSSSTSPSGDTTTTNPDSMNDQVSSPQFPVKYVILVVLVILVILVAIVGIIVIRRRKKRGGKDTDTTVSYNNRTYESGSPVQITVAESHQNMNIGANTPSNYEEVYNPVYQSSDGMHAEAGKEEVCNSAYESSGRSQQPMNLSGNQQRNGNMRTTTDTPTNCEEVHNPPVQSSDREHPGEVKEVVYNSAYESSVGPQHHNDTSGEEAFRRGTEYDYAELREGPRAESEYHYVDFTK